MKTDNFFVTNLFDWNWQRGGRWLERANGLLKKAGSSWTLSRKNTPFTHTTTTEQRINLWHLASQPLAYGVPGDLVELGCFDGKTAVIFSRAIAQFAPGRGLHLYDHFQVGFHLGGASVEQAVLDNFEQTGCPPPIIHRGDFKDTIPAELPDAVCFAHFDVGYDDDTGKQKETMCHLIQSVYDRMPPGAIGTFMDCYDPEICRGRNVHPGVYLAVSEFFADKPETIISLWGGDYSHTFFRKL